MELPFAGLHQLCAPMLDRLDALPEPQQDALSVALGPGLRGGARPLPGRAGRAQPAGRGGRGAAAAVLRRRRPVARRRVGARCSAFVARRLLAESVAIVFAVREPARRARAGGPAGAGARRARPRTTRAPCWRPSSRAGSTSASATGSSPRRAAIRWRCWSCRGAGRRRSWRAGSGSGGAYALPGRIEESFRRRLEALPEDTRLLLLRRGGGAGRRPVAGVARGRAARHRAAARDAGGRGGLLEIGAQVRFRHPLVRSAAYRSASPQERRAVHRALAEATDPQRRSRPARLALRPGGAGPGRGRSPRSWSARPARAQARGGLGRRRRVPRAGGDADARPVAPSARGCSRRPRAKRDAGALDAALELLGAVEAGPLDELQRGRVEQLRGQIAFDQRRVRRGGAAAAAGAARRLEPLDRRPGSRDAPRGARRRDVGRATGTARPDCEAVAAAARARRRAGRLARGGRRAARRVRARRDEGHAAAAPSLQRAREPLLVPRPATDDLGHWLWLAGAGDAVTALGALGRRGLACAGRSPGAVRP